MRRRHRSTELWIGDSHAMTFNRPISPGMFMRGPSGVLILRAGTRLMWSLATKGFPSRVLRVAAFIGRYGVPGAVTPCFVAGEIDVRCHLAGRDEDFSFVSPYVAQCLDIGRSMRAPTVVFVMPPPPSLVPPNPVELPVVGTFPERLAAFVGMRRALAEALDGIPEARLLDFTDLLADASGALAQEVTDDACHINGAGVVRVRRRIADLQMSRPAGLGDPR